MEQVAGRLVGVAPRWAPASRLDWLWKGHAARPRL